MTKRTTRARRATQAGGAAESYRHKDDALLRPDVGLQAQFKAKEPPAMYRYDPSLDPELSWDINADRERAEKLIAQIESLANELGETDSPEEISNLKSQISNHAAALRRMSSPFLNWAGKAERDEFSVPTLPLFVHERLSTKAILQSVKSHKRDKQRTLALYGDEELDLTDRILRAYEHKAPWVNRLILGDSLVVMNSLLRYEGLGGQVQMIYLDPPYGVKFGSNFQPFVRKRDVKHNNDQDFTREPEMVKAYRDTWELGLHSYLTYLRDRFRLCKELLHASGSIFVQISDENLHHVRELLDEVFGAENFVTIIPFYKTTSQTSVTLPQTKDYLIWFARDRERLKYRQLFTDKTVESATRTGYDWLEAPDGKRRSMTAQDRRDLDRLLTEGYKICALSGLTSSSGGASTQFEYPFRGRTYRPAKGGWKTNLEGMRMLESKNRLEIKGNSLRYVRYFNDFPAFTLGDVWTDVAFGGFVSAEKLYVVQTAERVVERCILMTTDPGDLVSDPTCGSGTTAYVAERWGRRWITIDTSRVPLALARQRLLTATFPYYQLRDDEAGVSGGFVYERKQNNKGDEVGGIVPHVTLKSIANNEPPKEEVLVDRPNVQSGVVRVSGPFVVEATIPTPMDQTNEDGGSKIEDGGGQPNLIRGRRGARIDDHADHIARMLEALRKSPVLRLPDNQSIEFKGVRTPARAMTLHAEGDVTQLNLKNGLWAKRLPAIGAKVAFAFGPANGAVTESLVSQARMEANDAGFTHLFVIGFACQEAARNYAEKSTQMAGIVATYVNATMDIAMGDLLKTTKASQLFSVTGAPEVKLIRLKQKSSFDFLRPRSGQAAQDKPEGETLYRAELLGLDVYYPPGYDSSDPKKDDVDHESGENVPAWLLDTDYNELCFYVTQAFFPRTAAWNNLKRALGAQYDDSVWEHFAGTVSEPFTAGEHGKLAVKVIDDRGNELLVVKPLSEAESE